MKCSQTGRNIRSLKFELKRKYFHSTSADLEDSAKHIHACQNPIGGHFNPKYLSKPERRKLACRDRNEGSQSLRHIKLSATYFSQQNQPGDGVSVDLSKNEYSGENREHWLKTRSEMVVAIG